VGLQFDFNAFQIVGLFAVVLLISLLISQTIGGFVGGKLSGFNWRDSLIIGVSLIPRNELALVVTAIGLKMDILKPEIFSALVFMAIMTTIVTPLLLKMIIKKG